MRLTALCLLAFPLFAISTPTPWEVDVTIHGDGVHGGTSHLEQPLRANRRRPELVSLSEEIPTFDDTRIKHHKDKLLLRRVRTFFKVFTTGDFSGMRDLQSEDYTMTDIPIAQIRVTRDEWFEINKDFVSLMDDLHVIAISLDGSSKPGHFSILEHVVLFRLTKEPPPPSIPHLPPGAKPGDYVGMVNLSVLFWDDEGLMCKEYEYGRLSWAGFNETEFDRKTQSVLAELKK